MIDGLRRGFLQVEKYDQNWRLHFANTKGECKVWSVWKKRLKINIRGFENHTSDVAIITNDYRSNWEHVKRRKSEIVDKTENKLLVIFKSHDGNAMMMMIERKTCERRFNSRHQKTILVFSQGLILIQKRCSKWHQLPHCASTIQQQCHLLTAT